MTPIKILDLDVSVTEGTSVTVGPPEATREVRQIEGRSDANDASANEAAAAGRRGVRRAMRLSERRP